MREPPRYIGWEKIPTDADIDLVAQLGTPLPPLVIRSRVQFWSLQSPSERPDVAPHLWSYATPYDAGRPPRSANFNSTRQHGQSPECRG